MLIGKRTLVFITLFALLIASVLSVSCAIKEIDHTYNGKTIDVKEGSNFEIVLESNPTTGYDWYLAESLALENVELIGSKYEQDPKGKEVMGAGGLKTFTFRAIKSGQATISLEYKREFEKDIEPIDRFSLEVLID